MRRLVEGMLTLARGDSGRAKTPMEPVALSELANETAMSFEPVAFEAGHPLEYELAENLTVRGRAGDLHAAWKVCLNVFDHLSAVATKTRAMVDAAHAANPRCEVLTTRKSMPGAKDLLTCAVMAGGAFPHRLGLSETVLVFEHHLTFFGGFERFVDELPAIKAKCIEKKLFVEADAERAITLARVSANSIGVDGIQLDKVPVAELQELVSRLRAIDPRLTLIAAGGINPQNAGAYAACGVDGLATTAPFTAKPIDMSVRMRRA